MPPEAGPALRLKQIQALLAVVPLTEKYLTLLRDVFLRSGKKTRMRISTDPAAPMAATHGAYESFDVPKGTIRGSPAIPGREAASSARTTCRAGHRGRVKAGQSHCLLDRYKNDQRHPSLTF